MTDELTTQQKLSRPFDVSEHAIVNKGGGDQTYVPWTEYVERLNVELGASGWSFRVEREGFTATEAWVLGEIVAIIDGERCVRQQYGCEPIAVGQKPNGDLLKKAASDAIKKAASLLGVGLYLSIKEERQAVQAAMRAEVQRLRDEEKRANQPKPNPTTQSRPSGATAAPATASTQAAPSAAPSSSSTTVTPGQRVDAAAQITGAPQPPTPAGFFCVECHGLIRSNDSVTILKTANGPKVTVTVPEYAPVCEQRLGGFHCGPCYDKKRWRVA